MLQKNVGLKVSPSEYHRENPLGIHCWSVDGEEVTKNRQHGFTERKSCLTSLIAVDKGRAKGMKINQTIT